MSRRVHDKRRSHSSLWGVFSLALAAGEVECDPAYGTGGFLLAAHDFIRRGKLDRAQLRFLNTEQLRGVDLPVQVKDALAGKHGEYELVLTKQLNFPQHVFTTLKQRDGPPWWCPTTCSSMAAPAKPSAASS